MGVGNTTRITQGGPNGKGFLVQRPRLVVVALVAGDVAKVAQGVAEPLAVPEVAAQREGFLVEGTGAAA